VIVAVNKVDRLDSDAALQSLLERWNGVAISALTGAGIDDLLARIDEVLRPRVERMTLFIPYRDGPALALCYDKGRVRERADEPEGIQLLVDVPRRLVPQLEAYRAR
jgi:GTP-binding protein HflX